MRSNAPIQQDKQFIVDAIVSSVAITPDNQFAWIGTRDGYLRVWDIATNTMTELFDYDQTISSIVISADGHSVLVGICNRIGHNPDNPCQGETSVYLWDVQRQQVVRSLPMDGYGIINLWLSSDSKRAIGISSYNSIRVWDVETGKPIRTFGYGDNLAMASAISSDGTLAAISRCIKDDWHEDICITAEVTVWNTENETQQAAFDQHVRVNALVFAPLAGTMLTSANRSGAYSRTGESYPALIDVDTGQILRTYEREDYQWDEHISLFPSGDRFITSDNGNLELWDMQSTDLIQAIPSTSPYKYHALTISADGTTIISAGCYINQQAQCLQNDVTLWRVAP